MNQPSAQTPAPGGLLLVEDNPANQIVARMMIAKMGRTLEVAHHGREALELLAKRAFDAVLMDCQMPVLDGYETTRQIRSGQIEGINPRVPIIALTAYATPADRRKCLLAGMDDYVSKPLRAEALAAALRRCGVATDLTMSTPPKAAAAESSAILDPEVVAQLRALPGARGPSLLPEVLEVFLQTGPKDLNEIAWLAAARESTGLVPNVHRFAGSCANLGAAESRDAAVALERAVEAGDWEATDLRLAELRVAFARLRAALEGLMKQGAPLP